MEQDKEMAGGKVWGVIFLICLLREDKGRKNREGKRGKCPSLQAQIRSRTSQGKIERRSRKCMLFISFFMLVKTEIRKREKGCKG